MSSIKKTPDRISFAKSNSIMPYPGLLDVQIESFTDFFQLGTKSEDRKKEGLFKVFLQHFPISDTRNNFVLEFKDYFIDLPRYSIDECIERGLTYSVSLRAKFKLYCTDPEHEEFETTFQDVYLGSYPYMTPSGSFIFNGSERVVVSQLHRSPGVFFDQTHHANGIKMYLARIIPFSGSWLEISTDIKNEMHAYIDRKKKFPITIVLRAIGYSDDKSILEIFDLVEKVQIKESNLDKILGRTLAARILNTWHEDLVDEATGEAVSIVRHETIIDRGVELDKSHIEQILEFGIDNILLQKKNDQNIDYSLIYNTLQKDPTNSQEEALAYIYRQLRNTEPPDEETARGIIEKLFFSETRYNLGDVGRYRLNKRLNLDVSQDCKVLTKEDIIAIIKHLNALYNSKKEVDDIDHLSNKRVKTVGEQLFAQFSIGFSRMARTIKERMNVRDNEVFTPVDLINAKTLSSVVNSFFGTSQLSQFMDQTNPLAELTHKRRLSSLGPGGLTAARTGFNARGIDHSHFGRLCLIETPEGANIGLIFSLCIFAKINNMGFIETPYRKVENGKVKLEEVIYLNAEEEEGKIIATSTTKLNSDGSFTSNRITTRQDSDFPVSEAESINYIDVAPNQISSISASLIPFLEHDDANRALMGSNMMRQAVPLLKPKSPIVGTGLEKKIAKDVGVLINAEGRGIVEYVDANKITICYEKISEEKELVSFNSRVKTYQLTKFRKTNQNTCINLRPIVKKGMQVEKGQVLCEGYATQGGELALGRDLKVAFMPWKGYNFEDAIVISKRVVREDLFTSIHIDEYSLEIRDTKLGMEEFTRDIPNVSEEAIKDLEEDGIVRIGAKVKGGDILIGKITPKGESDPTPEEKLLRAIFGEKASNVKNASLKADPSLEGVVIDKKIFSRSIKNKKSRSQDKLEIERVEGEYQRELAKLDELFLEKLYVLVQGRTSQGVFNNLNEEVIPKGIKFTQKNIQSIKDYTSISSNEWTSDSTKNELISELIHNYKIKLSELQGSLKRKKFAISVGDELSSGIVKMAKVYIAKKRKLKVGDKMAGRHGNKGIVSRIVEDEDMPFLEDGTPVDIVLNPLGVPSRMNIGQIYESVLGWAGHKLGQKFASPIFEGPSLKEIHEYTKQAGIPDFGTTYLYNGETGERFDQKITVGIIHMLKLSHMVDDKMHARSIGPYSLITQQPLGGKGNEGGQKLGEMEVWALLAYGSSAILNEMLTVKSDDIKGRSATYAAIVKGESLPEGGIPESYKVLTHELKGLGIDLNLEE